MYIKSSKTYAGLISLKKLNKKKCILRKNRRIRWVLSDALWIGRIDLVTGEHVKDQ